MKKWFHLSKGKLIGPFSTEIMIEKLRSQSIGPLDLLFLEGQKSWRSLRSFDEFSSFFTGLQNQTEEAWMVMKKSLDGNFVQEGPFTTAHLVEMINSGELDIDDKAWREGMQEWYPLKSFGELFSQEKGQAEQATEPILKVEKVYEETAENLLKNIKVVEVTKSKAASIDIPKDQPPVFDKKRSEEKHKRDLEKLQLKNEMAELKSKAQKLDFKIEGENPLNRVEQLRKSLDQMTSGLKVNDLLKQYGAMPSASQEAESSESNSEPEFDADSTRIISQFPKATEKKQIIQEKLSPVAKAPTEAKTKSKSVESDLAKSLKAKDRSSEKENLLMLLPEVLANEISALFPKGSFLRLALFSFLVLVTGTLVFYSAFKDKGKDKIAKTHFDQQIDIKKAEQEVIEQTRQDETEKQKKFAEENALKPASYVNVSIKDADAEEARVELSSDASKQFKYELLVIGKAGRIIGPKSYYHKFKVENEGSPTVFYFNQLDLPSGSFVIRVSIGDQVKERAFMRGMRSKNFMALLKRQRKDIAVWHQKERRALYASVERLKILTMQVASLLALRADNEKRWHKAYVNWLQKFDANESVYLQQLTETSASTYVHPDLWFSLRDLSQKLKSIAADKNSSATSFAKFSSNDLDAMSKEVESLTLW